MKDHFFQKKEIHSFKFDQKIASVFEDMLKRSIPCYQENLNMIGDLLVSLFVNKKVLIYDLGCSTGELFFSLIKKYNHKNLTLIGIDSSLSILKKAKKKLEIAFKGNLFLEHKKIEKISLNPCQAVILNYTLQFIKPTLRKKIIEKIYKSLKKNGVLILSEKITTSNKKLNDVLIKHYHLFKKKNGYSDFEIKQKQKALKKILTPSTFNIYETLLKKTGFNSIEILFKWYNFVSIIAFKK